MLRQPHLQRKWRPVRLTWSCARSSWPRSMQRSSVAPSLLSSLARPLLSSMERRNEEAVDVVALVHDGNSEIAGRESAEGRRRAVSVFVGDSVTRCGPSLSATPSAPCLYIECAQASRHFYVCIYTVPPGGHVWIRVAAMALVPAAVHSCLCCASSSMAATRSCPFSLAMASGLCPDASLASKSSMIPLLHEAKSTRKARSAPSVAAACKGVCFCAPAARFTSSLLRWEAAAPGAQLYSTHRICDTH